MGLPASGPVFLWIRIGVDHEVLMASVCIGPGDAVSGKQNRRTLMGVNWRGFTMSSTASRGERQAAMGEH